MKDVKPIVAENLTNLRKSRGLTQAQLAQRLDYSDKAVSRWEHGDTLPDINVLYQLCEFYGVTMDYLVHPDNEFEKERFKAKGEIRSRIAICLLAVSFVWLVATVLFACAKTVRLDGIQNPWKLFIWAIPASCFTLLKAARPFHNNLLSLLASSAFTWTLITSIYIQFLQYNFWLIFIVGAPIQVIIILGYNLKSLKKR